MSYWLYFLYFDLIKIKLGKLFVNFLLEKVNFKLWEDFKLLLIKDDFQINEDRLVFMICVKCCLDYFMFIIEQFKKYREEIGVNVCIYNMVIIVNIE